jgi:hypothetical protein
VPYCTPSLKRNGRESEDVLRLSPPYEKWLNNDVPRDVRPIRVVMT